MALLTPDRYFSRISAIDIERDLLGCGLTHVLLDIDQYRARPGYGMRAARCGDVARSGAGGPG